MNSPQKPVLSDLNKNVYSQMNDNELSAVEKLIIDRGFQDIENGNVISNAAVFEMATKWLKEK
ncbi:MAG: hypothetical protein RL440_732 [Bacteroidota bacterium]|jgi:hypothetical protein